MVLNYEQFSLGSGGSKIFLGGGVGGPNPTVGLFFQLFAENCMKMKEFGPRGRVPGAPLGSANAWSIFQSVYPAPKNGL